MDTAAQSPEQSPEQNPAQHPKAPDLSSGLETRLAAMLDPVDITLSQPATAIALHTTPILSDYDLNQRPATSQPQNLRPAAVLAPIVERPDGWALVLTVRAKTLVRHAGQIAFPGGRLDTDDQNLAHAALREAHEEIGLPPAHVNLLGSWETYETATGFCVTPYLGVITAPFTPVPAPGEVADVFEVPLKDALAPHRILTRSRQFQGQMRKYFQITIGERVIWGATAAMVKALSDRMCAADAPAKRACEHGATEAQTTDGRS